MILSLLSKNDRAGVGGSGGSLVRSGRYRFDLDKDDDRLEGAREVERRSEPMSETGELTALNFLGDLHREKGKREPIRCERLVSGGKDPLRCFVLDERCEVGESLSLR